MKALRIKSRRFSSNADATGVWRVKISRSNEELIYGSHYFVSNADGSARAKDLEIFVNGRRVTDVLGANPSRVLRFATCAHKFGSKRFDSAEDRAEDFGFKRCGRCGYRDYCWEFRDA